jgi:D-alanyl-D-alanine carboxypeptidase/D-alanyl-D-alanine-endopeptidase (penicillin-binding protein 4)
LGPNYRFHVTVFGDSELDIARKTLKGDLYLASDGDPIFENRDAAALGRALVRRGLRRVEGNLVVVGPLLLGSSSTTQRSAEQMRRFFSRIGIRMAGKVRCVGASTVDLESKVHYLSHYSEKLSDILWLQNAHSINEIADRLGDSLGGSEALRQFLIEAAQLEPDEIYVARPSGLEHNRMTPRAAVCILRALNAWLNAHQMKMQDIMPVAGIDEGTLFGRLRYEECRGGILGKTGTNPSKDGGISSLAGIAYTRDYGPVLYAIFNTNGRVSTYRRWQDYFLRNLMEESGGVGEYLPPRLETSALYSGFSAWVPSAYWETLPEESVFVKKTAARKTDLKKAKSYTTTAKNHRKISTRRTGA